MFSYSKGKNKYDNLPQQIQVTSFKKFAQDVFKSVSTQKGETYVCAAVASGFHKDTKKYPGEDHWRQQHLALPRRFLAFDFDGFEKPEVWEELREIFPWKGFLYTTASHTPQEPRARAIVELSKDVGHEEGVELGEAAQAYLETLITLGRIQFDKSVYLSTQPIYTPVEGFEYFLIKGNVLDVDFLITQNRANKAIKVFNQPIAINATSVGFNLLLGGSAEITEPIPAGQRNVTLLSIAGRYRARGHTQYEIEQLVLKDNEQWCDPPLDADEVLSIARRYEHQAKAEEYTGSIFTQDAANPNENTPPSEHRYTFLTSKQIQELPPVSWRVKGLLPEIGLASIYGPSQSGKSFFIIDLIARIALGEEFYGRKVKPCPVVYVVLEGAGGVPKRIEAYEKHFGTPLPDSFRIVTDMLSLMNSDSVLFSQAVIGEGFDEGVIVIDTLNQSAPGADENTSSDMGTIISNAQYLQKKTNSLVILVHHTGKDAARGARGHSSFFAALDAGIELKRPASGREWLVSKSKDGEDGISHPFYLQQIQLGKDEDGVEITSCVVQSDIFRANAPQMPQGKNHKAILEHLGRLQWKSMNMEELIATAQEALDCNNRRQRAKEAIEKLVELGHLVEKDGEYHLYDTLENVTRFRSPYRETEKNEKEKGLVFSENETKRENEASPS
jgi:hypothetical protein